MIKKLLLSILVASIAWASGGGYQQPAFTSPKNFSGLNFLFQSDNPASITVATGVSQWNDLSVNGFHATQGTGANQPVTGVDTINGRNVLKFTNASQQYLLFNGTMRPNTLGMVWKSAATPWADFYGVISARASAATITSNGAYNAGMQGISASTNICGIGQSSVSAYVDGVSVNAANFDSFLTGVSSSPITSAHTFIYTDDIAAAGSMFYAIGVDVFAATRAISGNIGDLWSYDIAMSPLQIVILQNYEKYRWNTP